MSDWIKLAIEQEQINLFKYDSFQNQKVIGAGEFDVVYKAFSNDIEKIIVLKRLYDDDNGIWRDIFIKDIKNISVLTHHENVAKFFGITQDPETKTYYRVLQFANNGDLRYYLSNHFSELDWETKIRMAKDISSGINFLHDADIVHSNLHDRNILVHNDKLMITDFGLSKSLENNTKPISGGTCAFSDPIYFENPSYKRDKASDIYSLGVLFWELSKGLPPFKNMRDSEITLRVNRGERESPIKGTPIEFMIIYCNAWNNDPNLRPSIVEICDKLSCMQMTQVVPVYQGNENTSIGTDISSYDLENFISPKLNNPIAFTEQRFNQLQVVSKDYS
ncbi:10479_t:CDS:2, partial [Cetraspora pellucida]